jgi:type VI secretion system secreted protein Hcp
MEDSVMAIYCNYKDFEGDVSTKNYEKMMELTSFDWGVDRNIRNAAGSPSGREMNVPEIHEIRVTKRVDKASVKLFQDATAGKLEGKCTINFTETTADEVKTFMTYELEDCGLSHYAPNSSDGGPPTETLVINFSKILMSLGSDRATYDLKQLAKGS